MINIDNLLPVTITEVLELDSIGLKTASSNLFRLFSRRTNIIPLLKSPVTLQIGND